MDKYLIELLKEISTIVIPGLGSLTYTKEGVYSFSSEHSDDDSALARHIAEREGWSENDAKNLIAKYVRAIDSKLNVGESYDMYRFGSFRKSSDGVIEFEAWSNTLDDREANRENIQITESLDENSVGNLENVESIVEEELTLQNASTISEIEEVDSPSVSEQSEPESIESESIPQIVEQKEEAQERSLNDEYYIHPVNPSADRPLKPILQKTQKDKKSRRKAPLITGISVILICIGTTLGLYYNRTIKDSTSPETSDRTDRKIQDRYVDSKKYHKEDDQQVVAQTQEVEAELIEKENNTLGGATLESVEPIKQTTGSDNFYLVLGCFNSKPIADSLSMKVKSNGYPALTSRSRKGFYFVSIGSYSSQQAASKALAGIKAVYPNVWIMKDI